ncbi:MAG: hypothetical protein WBF89_23670, partial [Steroidobacteraceae bacterium]
MNSVGRIVSRRPGFHRSAQHDIQLSGERPASFSATVLRVLRLALGCAVFAALAACNDSSSAETGSTSPSTDSATAVALDPSKPTVTLIAKKSSVARGTATTLQWSAVNAQSCMASGGWTGPQPINGTLTTSPLTATTNYTLTCSGRGGSASQSAEVVVISPVPTITLVASPPTISNGAMASLNWRSENATSCAASGGWQGSVATSGTWSTGALSNTTESVLTCTGTGGSATQSAIVTVSALAPSITLTANPSTVNSGSSTILTWSAKNATTCSGSDAWPGNKSLSGSQSSGALTASATYG